MANKPRPDCPVCNEKMSQLFRPEGDGYVRVVGAFSCATDPTIVGYGYGTSVKFAGAVPKPLGRPPGSKNKPKPTGITKLVTLEMCGKQHPHRGRHVLAVSTPATTLPKPKLGRPLGSKNKPKVGFLPSKPHFATIPATTKVESAPASAPKKLRGKALAAARARAAHARGVRLSKLHAAEPIPVTA